ncbi:MAG: phage tail protein [Pseudomonadota bacterium]
MQLTATIGRQVISNWQRQGRQLEKDAKIAARRAVNKTARWLIVQAARDVASKHKLSVGAVKKQMRLQSASGSNLTARLGVRIVGMNMIHARGARQNNRGVRAGGKQYDGAFIATMPKTGKHGVFIRKTKDRLPIRQVTFPIFGGLRDFLRDALGDSAEARLQETFDREFAYIRGQG